MGLDITAYSKAKRVENQKPRTDGDWDYVYAEGLIWVQNWGGWEQFEGLEEGLYLLEGESHSFRAGSYSGYNIWREELSKTILGVNPREIWDNPENFKGKPFVELINFSDCEGFIGPVASTKLYTDFTQHWTDFSQAVDSYSADKYNDWMRAFELASDNGFVYFH